MLYISVFTWIFGILSFIISVMGAFCTPVQDNSPLRKLALLVLYLIGSFIFLCILPIALAFLQGLKAAGFPFLSRLCYWLGLSVVWFNVKVIAPPNDKAPAWHIICVIYAVIFTVAGLF